MKGREFHDEKFMHQLELDRNTISFLFQITTSGNKLKYWTGVWIEKQYKLAQSPLTKGKFPSPANNKKNKKIKKIIIIIIKTTRSIIVRTFTTVYDNIL